MKALNTVKFISDSTLGFDKWLRAIAESETYEEAKRNGYAAMGFLDCMIGFLNCANCIHDVQKYYHKRVRVVKGRKVPLGTTGECFWMGQYDNSKYGDPWGIYTTTRIGIRDDDGGVHWTALSNVELA